MLRVRRRIADACFRLSSRLIPSVTGPDDFVLRGGSSIIGPDGAYVVEPVYDAEVTLHAELDMTLFAASK